eukprot:g7084.t1
MLRSTTGRFGGAHPDLSVMRAETSGKTAKPSPRENSGQQRQPASEIDRKSMKAARVVEAPRTLERLERALADAKGKLGRLEGEAEKTRKQITVFEYQIQRLKDENGGSGTPTSERTAVGKHQESPAMPAAQLSSPPGPVGAPSHQQHNFAGQLPGHPAHLQSPQNPLMNLSPQAGMLQMMNNSPLGGGAGSQPGDGQGHHAIANGGAHQQQQLMMQVQQQIQQQQQEQGAGQQMKVFGSDFRPLRVTRNKNEDLKKPELLFARATTVAQDSFRKVLGIEGAGGNANGATTRAAGGC